MIGIGKQTVQARLVGSTLVAAFRNSNPNLIWKFDLERNHSFTLALQGEDGDLELGITSSKGEFYPVVRFGSREDAEEAFTAVQKVLMKHRTGVPRGLLTKLCLLIIAVFLALVIGRYVVGFVSGFFAPSISGHAAHIQNGVPFPADQVLRPPQ